MGFSSALESGYRQGFAVAEGVGDLEISMLVAVGVAIGIEQECRGLIRGASGIDLAIACVERGARSTLAGGEACCEIAAAETSCPGIGIQYRCSAAARENLDHAAYGVGSVQTGERSLDDFDALDEGKRNIFEGRRAKGRGPDAQTVNQNQGMTGVGAAHENARWLPGAAGRANLHIGAS